jgi:predicted DNA-binding transcriptional regulator AlpA
MSQNAESPIFFTFADVGAMFGQKSAKTIGRWIQTISGFPQPVRVGCSRLFLREEVEAYVEKLKEKRDKGKN